ncbi:MAG: hypothetical protein LBQ54_05230, partial [Planctomycetaceae bacterium]|nr:hypothetical protein [Planctomycetaceae bacterium]
AAAGGLPPDTFGVVGIGWRNPSNWRPKAYWMQRHVAPFALLTGVHERNNDSNASGEKDDLLEAEWNEVTMRQVRCSVPRCRCPVRVARWYQSAEQRETAGKIIHRKTNGTTEKMAKKFPLWDIFALESHFIFALLDGIPALLRRSRRNF